MDEIKNVKDALFDYVKDPKTWFYWYHSPERLEVLYDKDHKDVDEGYKDGDEYKKDNFNFTKRVWRFKSKPCDFIDGKTEIKVYIQEDLFDFFGAVLDEVRLKKANDFAEYALYISDNEDLAYFRNTVAKREITADIDYDRQRDHAVHTLYNYLLGWYIFEYSEKLRDAFRSHFEGKLKIYPPISRTRICTDFMNHLNSAISVI